VIVVNCVVNVVFKHHLFRGLKIRQLFELYFWGEGEEAGFSTAQPTVRL